MKPSLALEPKRAAVREIAHRFHTANPRVFGSVLHGLDQDGSDLDLLVDVVTQGDLLLTAPVQSVENMVEKSLATKSVLRDPYAEGACFAAGTLVHTDKGLVPIRDIKVGDMVLSQPEMKGERAYKRVLNTFRYKEKEVCLVNMFPKEEFEAADKEERFMRIEMFAAVVVTGNHPFWVNKLGDRNAEYSPDAKIGWTRADSLDAFDELELYDGRVMLVERVEKIHRTITPDVGWARYMGGATYGQQIDLRNNKVYIEEEPDIFENFFNVEVDWQDDTNLLKHTVYNIEVEEFHTYYVGEQGIWVHNKNCAEKARETITAAIKK